VEENQSEANYEPLQENLKLLRRTGLRVVTLPMHHQFISTAATAGELREFLYRQ